jgi:vacuolar-type H+-ATPase subunit F/Vma7
VTKATVTVVIPPDLEPGFRLAGVTVRVAADATEAATAVAELIADGERGVIAVYEPYLHDFDPGRREQWEASVSPVIVGLPSGLGVERIAGRRTRIAGLLQRAVGYHITFGDEE